MKNILIIVLSLALLFSLSTCKSNPAPTDIFSASFAKEKNRNTAGMAQAKTFTVKAMALHKQKKYAAAEIEWKNALKIYADAEMYYRFGDTLFNLSRFEDAVKAYKNAIELNHPEKKFVYYNMACAYSKMKDKNNGIKYLDIAIYEGYDQVNQIRNDIDLNFVRKNIKIELLLTDRQNNSQLKKYMSQSFIEQRKKNVGQKANAHVKQKLAIELFQKNRYGEAIIEILQALDIYVDADLYFNFGEILFALKKYELSGDSFILSANLKYILPVDAYYNAARAYSLSERYYDDRGFKYLNHAVKINPAIIKKIRNDFYLIRLCLDSKSQHMIGASTLYPNISKYCYTDDLSENIDIIGKWYYDILVPPACGYRDNYTFYVDGKIRHLTSGGSPEQTTIKYGYYKLYNNKIFFNFYKLVTISRSFSSAPIRHTSAIQEQKYIPILAKNKNILIIRYDNAENNGALVKGYNRFAFSRTDDDEER